MKKAIAFILVAFFAVSSVFAQTPAWKSARHSIYWGVGANLSQTDICPSDGMFPCFKTINGSMELGYQYRISERFYLRGNAMVSRLQGFDADSDCDFTYSEDNAAGRRANFRTWVFDINAMVDFYLIKMKNITSESSFGQRWGIYLTAGFGGAFYQPMSSIRTAEDQNVWIHTRPLQVEGRHFNTATWTLPAGLGFKYQFSNKFAMGLEVLQHICFTDYIDGFTGNVMGATADKGVVAQLQNALKGTSANPRGGEANDYYPTVMLNFTHNFTGCGVAHKARPKYMD